MHYRTPVFSSGYGHMDETVPIHELVCTSILCLAKEDPDNNASIRPIIWAIGTGSFVQTSTHACLSDPTQSTCCDESQLLLGFPPAIKRSSPIEDYPRHNRHSCVRKSGSAVWWNQNYAFHYVSTWSHQRI